MDPARLGMKRSLYTVREAGVAGAEDAAEEEGRCCAPEGEEGGQEDCAPAGRRAAWVEDGVGGFELGSAAAADGDGGCWWCSMAGLRIGDRDV